MKVLEMLFISMRPHKWSRSIIVFLPLLFSGDPLNWVYLIKIFVAFLIFSFLTGTVYIIEDLTRINIDKTDSTKKFMPIASGELSSNKAEFAVAFVLIGSFVAAFFLNTWFGLLSILYFLLKLANFLFAEKTPLFSKNVISGIASLIVITAGTVAISKPISNWLIFYIFTTSVLISLCCDIKLLQNKNQNTKDSESFLNQIINITSSTALAIYCMFCLSTLEGISHNLIFTFPLVLFGTYRLLYLTFTNSEEKFLEKILLKDWPFLANIFLWVILTSALVKFI